MKLLKAVLLALGAVAFLLVPPASYFLLLAAVYPFDPTPYGTLDFGDYLAAMTDDHSGEPTLGWQWVIATIASVLCIGIGYTTARLGRVEMVRTIAYVSFPSVILGWVMILSHAELTSGDWAGWFYAGPATVCGVFGAHLAIGKRSSSITAAN